VCSCVDLSSPLPEQRHVLFGVPQAHAYRLAVGGQKQVGEDYPVPDLFDLGGTVKELFEYAEQCPLLGPLCTLSEALGKSCAKSVPFSLDPRLMDFSLKT
jgi:hypothetical protein